MAIREIDDGGPGGEHVPVIIYPPKTGNPSTPPGGQAGPQPITLSDQGTALPIIFGTAKVGVNLIEKYAPVATQPDAWAGSVFYVVGRIVSNVGNAYECTLAGTSSPSGSPPGPTGTGAIIIDGTCNWKYRQPLPCPIYKQSFAAAVCEGQITGVLKMWWDKEIITAPDLTHPGKGLALSLGPDAANQVLAPSFDAMAYQHTAVCFVSTLGATDTGTQQELPDIALEIQGVVGFALPDSNPADIVNVLLTDTRRGRGWPSGRVDTSITGAGAGTYRTYCDAAGFRMSMVLDQQRGIYDWVMAVLRASNSDCVWSGGALKVIPLGDTNITSPVFGAVNYTAPNAAVYDLGPSDFLDPLEVTRRGDVDCFNSIPVEYTDRTQGYARVPVEDPDQIDVDKRGGLRRGSTMVLDAIFPDGTAPVMLSRILAQRSLYVRNTYRFRVSWQTGLLLEPTDVVTLTDPIMGLSLVPVRITESNETEQGFEFYAEDYPAGVSHAGRYQPQVGDGYAGNDKATTAIVPSAVDGVAIGILPGIVTRGQQTPQNHDNLWPNPSSEVSPPAGVTVLDDGSNPEFDLRSNVGAGAYSGNWVRRLAPTTANSIVAPFVDVPAAPGDCFYIEAQVKKVSGTPGTGGVGNVQIIFFDASNSNLGSFNSVGTNSAAYGLEAISGVAPAGTTHAWLRVSGYAGTTASTAVYYFDAIYARRQIGRAAFEFHQIQCTGLTGTGYVQTWNQTEPDTNYAVVFTPVLNGVGAVPDASFIIGRVVKTTIDVTFDLRAAPGAGPFVTFEIVKIRL